MNRIDPVMAAVLQDYTWGTVPPRPNVQTWLQIDSLVFRDEYQINLNVVVQPIEVVVAGRRYHVPPETVAVNSTSQMPLQILQQNSDSERWAMIRRSVGIAVSQVAPLLYESDPRIWSKDQVYPALPLFDPPGGVEFFRVIRACVLCSNPDAMDLRVWGGGNVGWVHPTCLAQAHR